jgi:membrane protein YqaA with SNARE-associated domain
MSDFENPYNSPESPIVPEKAQQAGNLTETMLRYLREASPWMQFFGVIYFISAGFCALGGIISLFTFSEFNPLLDTLGIGQGGGLGFLIFIFYMGIGALSFFFGLFAFNFGAKIKKYQYSNIDEDLEQAFKNNKSYWKLSGILTIIALSFIPIIIVIAIIAGVATAAGLF